MSKEGYVVVRTGLKDSCSKSILENVLGQLSDGLWENSRVASHYWPYAEVDMVDGEVCFLIRTSAVRSVYDTWYPNTICHNYFLNRDKCGRDPRKIRLFFAKRILSLVREERKAYPKKGIKFSRSCDVLLSYFWDHESSDYSHHKVSDVYNVYKVLTM